MLKSGLSITNQIREFCYSFDYGCNPQCAQHYLFLAIYCVLNNDIAGRQVSRKGNLPVQKAKRHHGLEKGLLFIYKNVNDKIVNI